MSLVDWRLMSLRGKKASRCGLKGLRLGDGQVNRELGKLLRESEYES